MIDYVALLNPHYQGSLRSEAFKDNVRLIAPEAHIHDVLKTLKSVHGFDMLTDLAGIDYLGYPDANDRFAIVYALTNITTGDRLFVKTFVNDPDPELPSVVHLWRGADWMEREVYDMYGIRFTGHPDLRRILMPEGATCYPLRKDYPLRGHGERHNFPLLTRAEG
jgi:NADH-quinone oxidoreductase subunit C